MAEHSHLDKETTRKCFSPLLSLDSHRHALMITLLQFMYFNNNSSNPDQYLMLSLNVFFSYFLLSIVCSYIFPGVGLGCIVSKAMTITDEDMYIAAVTLASCVTQSQLDIGNAYPPLSTIRDVSHPALSSPLYITRACYYTCDCLHPLLTASYLECFSLGLRQNRSSCRQECFCHGSQRRERTSPLGPPSCMRGCHVLPQVLNIE